MKTKNYLIMLLISMMGIVKYGQGQNPAWILTPNYKKTTLTPLPTNHDYNGDPATCASNMQLDADNNILFFIVDGKVYDGEGYAIGDLTLANSINYQVKGTAEITIVPAPCKDKTNMEYYIFLAGAEYYNGSSPFHAFVAKIDMSQPTNYFANPGRLGKVEFCKDLQDYVPSGVPDIAYAVKSSALFFAASKERADDSRFVFVSGISGLYRFKLSSSGLQFDKFWSYVPKYANHSSGEENRGEMELVELTGQGTAKYRLAIVLKMNLQSSSVSAQSVLCLDLNDSGDVIKDTLLRYDYHANLPVPKEIHPYIHGVEFSPDGSKLYITHCTNQFYPNAFEYYDFSNSTAGIQPVPGVSQNQASNFQYSQIEIGKSGNSDILYLAYGSGLASLSNPNNPSAGGVNMTAVSFGYNYNMQGVSYYSDGLKSYLLPDQIDGMDYSALNTGTSLYQIGTYTAQTSGTWEPGSNVFNNTTAEIYVKDSLIIPNNVSINIQNMVFHFAPNARVIIKQGGKLTLDGGTFTNTYFLCADNTPTYWQGIEVWGTSNQNQAFSNGHPAHQGMLVLQNGGTIEYAHVAAQNWKPGNYNNIGGVIQTTDGAFHNNRKDAVFMSYQNFVSGNPSMKIGDISYFSSTDFISDNDFIEGLPRQPHVTMWDVHGIHFNGCHFANNKIGPKYNSTTPNKGIYSVDASYSVGPQCTSSVYPCPAGSLEKSSFYGLLTAIEADGAGSSGTVTVTQTTFTDNINGVLVNEIDNASIDRNTFTLGDVGYNMFPMLPTTEKGIEISNSTGFIVEENSINGTYNPFIVNNDQSHGIIIKNAGDDDNRVYNNDLSNVMFGTDAFGLNRYDYFYVHTGLQFLCNTYQSYKYAINIGTDPTDGIRLYQGTYNSNASLPAQNVFHGLNPISQSWDINNGTDGSIDYFYNPSASNVLPENPSGFHYVTLAPTTAINTCPSSYSSGGGVIFQPISLLITKTDSLQTAYNNLHYNYLSLIDGGSTEQLKSEVENTWPNEAWDLRESLLAESPYLSQEVLLSTAEKGVLPDAMLLEVLLANPDATRGEGFIDKLRIATNNTFPEYMIQYVINNRGTETTRTTLENAMGGLQEQMAGIRRIVKYRNKSKDSFALADRLATVQLGSTLSDRMGEMDYYIEHKQWNNAQSVLDSIQADKSNQEQLSLVANYATYIDFRSNLGEKTLAELDSSEIMQLQQLAEDQGRVAGYAQNILCFFYHICYNDSLPTENVSVEQTNTVTPDSTLNEVLYKLTLSPNPATSNVTIGWTIYDELTGCHYVIQSLKDGSTVAQGTITQNEGNATVAVSTIPNGYYVVKIINDGKVKTQDKLVIE